MTITRDLIDVFLREQKLRGNSPRTMDFYTVTLGYFADYAGDREITLEICRSYQIDLTQRDLSSVSIQTYIRALRSFLSWAHREGLIAEDIPERLRLPKAERKVIDILDDREISQLMNAAAHTPQSDRDLAIVALMLDSGLRFSEVVTATADRLHLLERYIIVSGKGHKQRFVPFGHQTAELLERLPDSGALFRLADGSQMTDAALKDLFRRLRKKSGIDKLHPHLLRHTFATRYLENGGNIYTLQVILGHTSLEMVKRYLHLANTRIRRDFDRYSPLDRLHADSKKD